MTRGYPDARRGVVGGLDDPGRLDRDRHGTLPRLWRRDPVVRHAGRATSADQSRRYLALRDVPRRGFVQAPPDEPWANVIAAGLGALTFAIALVVFLGMTAR